MSFDASVQRAPVAPAPTSAARHPVVAPAAAPAANPLLKNPLAPAANPAGAAALMRHYAEPTAGNSSKKKVDAPMALGAAWSMMTKGAETSFELSHDSAKKAAQTATDSGDAAKAARNADAAASAGKLSKYAGRAGLAGDAVSLGLDVIKDPKHADNAVAKAAGSYGGAALGTAAAGFTGPLAPVTAPLFATAGGLAGGYAAEKLYPVAKSLVKENPIGSALGAPLGPGGMLAGAMTQKGVEFAAPHVAHAAEWGLHTADSLATNTLHTAGDLGGHALSTADHLGTSALHTAGDVGDHALDAGGDALHTAGSVAKKLDPTGLLG